MVAEVSRTWRHESAPVPAAPRCAWLFRALACAAPRDSSARWPLDGVDEVIFARGRSDGAERAGARLTLRFADKRVSSLHARLSRQLGGWVLEDAGSTNGSFVNDSRVERVRLLDGDRLEIGHGFFVFRASQPLDVSSPAELALPGLQTQSPELQARFAELATIAPSLVPVIVLGASGTGKELAARAVHALSQRSGPFVAVNCGALPTTLVQSELFGYKRGAFSGADEDRPGLVRSADRGTLFLDEIGDLPLPSQAALLRVLQEREVTPLGATRPVPVDVRVVAATHCDLEALVAAGRFRADLLARLAGWTLRLPSLAARREDLGLLVGRILEGERVTLSWAAARIVMRHAWPLNMRELEKALRAALVLSGGDIDVQHLPPALQNPAAPAPHAFTPAAPASDEPPSLNEADEARRAELARLFEAEAGNVAAVARALGKAPVQIRRWARRYALDPDRYRR